MVRCSRFLFILFIDWNLDGSCKGVRYFDTEPNRGLFCRPEKVQRLAKTRHSMIEIPRRSLIGKSNDLKS